MVVKMKVSVAASQVNLEEKVWYSIVKWIMMGKKANPESKGMEHLKKLILRGI